MSIFLASSEDKFFSVKKEDIVSRRRTYGKRRFYALLSGRQAMNETFIELAGIKILLPAKINRVVPLRSERSKL